MAATNTMPLHADLLAGITQALATRPLKLFAQESRQDGESLQDAIQRYEVDYAWHILASDRLRDETFALLAARLKQPVSEAQKACVAEVLKAAAAGQAADLLMSFDSDVPERLAAMLCARQARMVPAEVEAVS